MYRLAAFLLLAGVDAIMNQGGTMEETIQEHMMPFPFSPFLSAFGGGNAPRRKRRRRKQAKPAEDSPKKKKKVAKKKTPAKKKDTKAPAAPVVIKEVVVKEVETTSPSVPLVPVPVVQPLVIKVVDRDPLSDEELDMKDTKPLQFALWIPFKNLFGQMLKVKFTHDQENREFNEKSKQLFETLNKAEDLKKFKDAVDRYAYDVCLRSRRIEASQKLCNTYWDLSPVDLMKKKVDGKQVAASLWKAVDWGDEKVNGDEKFNYARGQAFEKITHGSCKDWLKVPEEPAKGEISVEMVYPLITSVRASCIWNEQCTKDEWGYSPEDKIFQELGIHYHFPQEFLNNCAHGDWKQAMGALLVKVRQAAITKAGTKTSQTVEVQVEGRTYTAQTFPSTDGKEVITTNIQKKPS